MTLAAPNTNTDRTITLPDATGTINISGLANEVPAGSAGSPSIYPTGDTNTGVFFPAADTVAITTGGVERLRVNSLGKLNINTGTLGTQLEVNGSFAAGDSYIAKAASSLMFMRNLSGVNRIDSYDYPITANYPLQFLGSPLTFATADTERMRIDSSGNVSIGGYTPGLGTRLAMYGGIRFLTTETAANTYTGIGSIASDTVSISTSGTERMSIGTSGVVTIANLAGAGSRAVNASATGVLSAASDSRLKQEVPEASIAGLAEIMQLRPVAYKWLDDIANRGDEAAVELGFFADEAKDIIPSAAPMGNDGYYGFYDRAVIAALTKAVQEQQQMIQALQADIAALKGV
jgi:hypothetical protein